MIKLIPISNTVINTNVCCITSKIVNIPNITLDSKITKLILVIKLTYI